jgi:hypothetical protein
MKNKKQRFRVKTKLSFGGGYYYSSFIYCKNFDTIERTKAYKNYLNKLEQNEILAFQIERF